MSKLRDKQIAEAEELLGKAPEELSFARSLFFGRYQPSLLPSYPERRPTQLAAELTEFCRTSIDPVKIDREARIPDEVIAGLGRLGILGACLPKRVGGLDLSQSAYCELLEVLGAHCASTALFVNAHHSIGPRAIVLFGAPAQQQEYLPKLATGEWISAFALTESEAGSDASNVQSRATPTADGAGYVIDGDKRWITNGGIAQVLTVMARTPVAGSDETKITAFIVTPDMPGFRVVEERMEKMGVRGTATSRLAFRDLYVPRENVLGEVGRGLKVALTVLDFGRTTFGASCTGAAKFCVARAREHANRRVQFQQTLGSFELVKEKIAAMQADAFAMEACTYQTAALIDAGVGDFMLETAILKVFATDRLWRIIHDTFQIHGGLAYFTDEPWERMVRDHRIDLIGEGANDVLRAFSALVGLREVGMELEGLLRNDNPIFQIGRILSFAGRQMGTRILPPVIEVRCGELEDDAARLARTVSAFGHNLQHLLAQYQKGIVDRQYQLGRVADAAIELYVSACVLARLERSLCVQNGDRSQQMFDLLTGRYYLRTAERRIRTNLAAMWDNDDDLTTALAQRVLR